MVRTVKLSAVVMSHPRRLHYARQLVTSQPEGALRIVLDPCPGDPPNTLRTALRAWSAIAPGASHHLVIQDDALLTEDFLDHVRRAIMAMPDVGIILHANWDTRNSGSIRLGALTGAQWVEDVDNSVTPCVALVLPREVALGFVRFAASAACQGLADDQAMKLYLTRLGIRTYISVPNLANHRDLRSLAGNQGHGRRQSPCFFPKLSATTQWHRDRRLEGVRVVPYLGSGLAKCIVRKDPQERDWKRITTEEYITSIRLSPVLARRELEVELATGHPSVGAAVRHIERELAFAVWITAFALGVVSHTDTACRETMTAASGAWEPSLVDRALGTIALGGLCKDVEWSVLCGIADGLHRLARLGLWVGRRTILPGMVNGLSD